MRIVCVRCAHVRVFKSAYCTRACGRACVEPMACACERMACVRVCVWAYVYKPTPDPNSRTVLSLKIEWFFIIYSASTKEEGHGFIPVDFEGNTIHC